MTRRRGSANFYGYQLTVRLTENKGKPMGFNEVNESQTGLPTVNARLLGRSTVLVGIDDTENLASPGTGWLAQSLCHS